MTAEQQLERSVLEGKERDELSAIAQAMSLKTTSRTKKADIIDQILDATGVTSGSAAASSSNGDAGHAEANGAKPARRSRSATAATANESGATESGDTDSGDTASDASPAVAVATAPVTDATAEAAGAGDSGPAVFVEPPELADGGDAAPRQNGQGGQGQNQQGNRNRQNQSNQNRNQADGDVGNRRSRRRRGRERGGQGGELQGGGQEQPYSGEMVEVKGMLDLRDEGYGFLRCEGYLPSPKDVVRVDQPGPPLRAAPGRLRGGRVPSGVEQREVPGAAAHRLRLGPRPRSGAQPAPLRGSHPVVPRLAAQPRAARRQGQSHSPASWTCSRPSARVSAA